MLYIVPGLLAGILFYLLLAIVSRMVEAMSSRKRRLRAHGRLVIHCLAAVGFTMFLVIAGGGGNWATHMQMSGFLLAGCLLSFVTAIRDKTYTQE